jgi:hypothetical protein
VLQPLLAGKRIADRRLQLGHKRNHLVARIAAAVASEDHHALRVFDKSRQREPC